MLPSSDKVARHIRSILSFASEPSFARDIRLLAIDMLNLEGEIIKHFLVSFMASILSTSFFKTRSKDLK